MSPDGSTVFVTGHSTGSTSSSDYATVAYNASTGAVAWAKRYNGSANVTDDGRSLAVSPDGSTVFVTGESFHSGGYDYATVAYNASTGGVAWAKSYNNGNDYAVSVAVSPDGSMVFVTGQSTGSTSGYDYATVAYSTS